MTFVTPCGEVLSFLTWYKFPIDWVVCFLLESTVRNILWYDFGTGNDGFHFRVNFSYSLWKMSISHFWSFFHWRICPTEAPETTCESVSQTKWNSIFLRFKTFRKHRTLPFHNLFGHHKIIFQRGSPQTDTIDHTFSLKIQHFSPQVYRVN